MVLNELERIYDLTSLARLAFCSRVEPHIYQNLRKWVSIIRQLVDWKCVMLKLSEILQLAP